ncbi:MAG: RDD family protein [Janthinobacterium lividum]
MATIRIHTTQNVTLEYEVASIGDRIVATLIDYLILVAWGVLWGFIVAAIAKGGSDNQPINYRDWAELVGVALAALLGFIIVAPFIFYFLLSEILFNGQTLGKKARDLRVVRLDGTAPRVGDYLLRWLLRLVDFGFGGGLVAVVAIAASGKGQRLGDMAAGTTVISQRHQPTGLADLPTPDALAGYQPVFAQAADLSDHDVVLLRQLLSRSIKQGNYVLLNEAAAKIKQLLGVHTDLPDEAFLQTVLRDHTYLAAQG